MTSNRWHRTGLILIHLWSPYDDIMSCEIKLLAAEEIKMTKPGILSKYAGETRIFQYRSSKSDLTQPEIDNTVEHLNLFEVYTKMP